MRTFWGWHADYSLCGVYCLRSRDDIVSHRILGRVNRCSFAYVVRVCMCATACACVCRCMQAAREEGSTEQIHDWHNLADQAICNGPAVYNLAMHAPKLYQSELRHSIQITEDSRIY